MAVALALLIGAALASPVAFTLGAYAAARAFRRAMGEAEYDRLWLAVDHARQLQRAGAEGRR